MPQIDLQRLETVHWDSCSLHAHFLARYNAWKRRIVEGLTTNDQYLPADLRISCSLLPMHMASHR
jgi:hypothetical protein